MIKNKILLIIILCLILSILSNILTILTTNSNLKIYFSIFILIFQIFLLIVFPILLFKNYILPIKKILSNLKEYNLNENFLHEIPSYNTNTEIEEIIYHINRILKQTENYKEKLYLSNTELANIDWLTNLGNKNGFEKKVLEELNRAKRTSSPLSILFIEIDDIKRISEKYNQKIIDKILITVAKIIKENFRRAGDYTARYSSAKFASVLSYTDVRGANIVAEKLQRRIIEEMQKNNFIPENITVSIGIYSFIPSIEMDKDSIIKIGLKTLESAKDSGKNKIKTLVGIENK